MREILEELLDMSDLDHCQSAEDMQQALEEIHDKIKDILETEYQ